jgi:hypothetical protein
MYIETWLAADSIHYIEFVQYSRSFAFDAIGRWRASALSYRVAVENCGLHMRLRSLSLRVRHANDYALAERHGCACDGIECHGDIARVEQAIQL